MPGTNPIWKGCAPGNFQAGRPAGFRPEAVVVHIMDGTLSGTASWFNDPRARVSAHYGVGRDGAVHQYVKETDTAFHAGTVVQPTWRRLRPRTNPNFYTIGIEHEGRGSDAWPEAQLRSSADLIARIAMRWNIMVDDEHIITHHMIRANKPCPGRGMVLRDHIVLIAEAMERLRAAAAPPPPWPSADRQPGPVLLANANLRPAPRTDTRVLRIMSAGERFAAIGAVTDGEMVNGNALWYFDAEGRYLWAGATDRPS